MTYSIVFESLTGNTQQLVQTIRQTLPPDACIYCGGPAEAAKQADLLFVGSWTDKGTCCDSIGAFLSSLSHQQVFLFGTAGFGGNPAYFDTILAAMGSRLPSSAVLTGGFLCQGKMPLSIREKYEALAAEHPDQPQIAKMLENFQLALSHPDQDDLSRLREQVSALWDRL